MVFELTLICGTRAAAPRRAVLLAPSLASHMLALSHLRRGFDPRQVQNGGVNKYHSSLSQSEESAYSVDCQKAVVS